MIHAVPRLQKISTRKAQLKATGCDEENDAENDRRKQFTDRVGKTHRSDPEISEGLAQ
jgi:hypothetical protein